MGMGNALQNVTTEDLKQAFQASGGQRGSWILDLGKFLPHQPLQVFRLPRDSSEEWSEILSNVLKFGYMDLMKVAAKLNRTFVAYDPRRKAVLLASASDQGLMCLQPSDINACVLSFSESLHGEKDHLYPLWKEGLFLHPQTFNLEDISPPSLSDIQGIKGSADLFQLSRDLNAPVILMNQLKLECAFLWAESSFQGFMTLHLLDLLDLQTLILEGKDSQ